MWSTYEAMESHQPSTGSVLTWFGQWSHHPAAKLPARVERALMDLGCRNEILIGWVQLTLVLVFGALYLVAPSTAPSGTSFRPVPWTLSIYGLFTVLRLVLAYRRRLPHLVKVLSVLVDMSMLMLTIWSFHIEYGQPAAFYLKAPTLLYVFIFIVLRALAIAPGFVLFAGLTAASGWLLLLAYALLESGGGARVTHNYVQYMNSAMILIGGEIDKVVSIVIVTLVLSVAVARSRQLLFHAVGDQAAVNQLTRFFSPEIAGRLASADELLQAGDGEQLEAAAMFIDLRGFTRLAAVLSPGDLIGLLREYQGVAVPIVHRHHGSIATFLGDGIMVTFGATGRTGTYCADALRCSEELLVSLQGWSQARERRGLPAPGVGIGMDTGTVTCGVIGDDGRLEYAIIGDPVNRAAKLQNHTKVEGVAGLMSSYFRERALEQGYAAVGPHRTLTDRAVSGVPGLLTLAVIA